MVCNKTQTLTKSKNKLMLAINDQINYYLIWWPESLFTASTQWNNSERLKHFEEPISK